LAGLPELGVGLPDNLIGRPTGSVKISDSREAPCDALRPSAQETLGDTGFMKPFPAVDESAERDNRVQRRLADASQQSGKVSAFLTPKWVRPKSPRPSSTPPTNAQNQMHQ
jgi:hypothetical protein